MPLPDDLKSCGAHRAALSEEAAGIVAIGALLLCLVLDYMGVFQ